MNPLLAPPTSTAQVPPTAPGPALARLARLFRHRDGELPAQQLLTLLRAYRHRAVAPAAAPEPGRD